MVQLQLVVLPLALQKEHSLSHHGSSSTLSLPSLLRRASSLALSLAVADLNDRRLAATDRPTQPSKNVVLAILVIFKPWQDLPSIFKIFDVFSIIKNWLLTEQ